MTDAEALRRFNFATNAINRAVAAHGVWCAERCCQRVYRVWAERHAEVERRGLDWRERG